MSEAKDVVDLMAAVDDEVGEALGVDGRAALLVALAHSTRDQGVWGGDRALTYWDRLPEKVRAATFTGPTLAHWWERMCRTLGSHQPYRQADRLALGKALVGGDDAAVLAALRDRSEALCLRVRLSIQLRKDAS